MQKNINEHFLWRIKTLCTDALCTRHLVLLQLYIQDERYQCGEIRQLMLESNLNVI